jgi:hypothetical protein
VVALENCSGYKQAFCPVRLPYKKEFFHERN